MSTEGSFVWCDLSAYRPEAAQGFCAQVLGWSFMEQNGYALGYSGIVAAAGIYQMPENFMDMGMPSFWMSYVAVPDVAATVSAARAEGGKVELEADDHALIRDPLGAGFTVHSGREKGFSPPRNAHGLRTGHGYFCSDVSVVEAFYSRLFGWSFEPSADGYTEILARDGTRLATALELRDDQRGKEQYWAVRIGVSDLGMAIEQAERAGATEILDVELPEGPAAMIRDPDGAAFFISEVSR